MSNQKKESWVCPVCETLNTTSVCTVCGTASTQMQSTNILTLEINDNHSISTTIDNSLSEITKSEQPIEKTRKKISKNVLSLIFLVIGVVIALGIGSEFIPTNNFKPDDVPVPIATIIATGKHGNNLTWDLDDQGYLTIRGTGEMMETIIYDELENVLSYEHPEWHEYTEPIKHVIIENGVTSISAEAFFNMEYLESVQIPDSVTSIGNSAFACCPQLSDINIPDTVNIFSSSVFEGCDNLPFIAMGMHGDNIKWILHKNGELIISGNGPMKESFLVEDDESAWWEGFPEWLNFYDIIKKITIEHGITSISGYAFEHLEYLDSITIPNSVVSIGEFAFQGCISLSEIIIPNSVTVIDTCAFDCCESLTVLELPNSITHIGISAFSGCYNMEQIIIHKDVTDSYNWDADWNWDCSANIIWDN